MNIRASIKHQIIHGHRLAFRDATPDDAAFILSLRLDVSKNAYLNAVGDNISQQEAYLKSYQQQNESIYFIILDKQDLSPIGTVRIYDIKGDSFSWGSWILIDNPPPKAAIESACMIYHIGINLLAFKNCHFEVRKGNQKVIDFHKRFGAWETHDNETDVFFTIDRDTILSSLSDLERFLPEGIHREQISS